MRLPDENYEYIKGEVIALFEKYDIKCIPISGFELATNMRISLIAYSTLSYEKRKAAIEVSTDGFFIEKNDGREVIYYNDSVEYPRTNMTILHEIGHCVLDHKSGTEEEEAEASFFAKYAAAPPPLIHRTNLHTVEDIAQTFDLSYEASYYALNYYCKWLSFGQPKHIAYEEKLLRIFDPKNNKMAL